MFSATETT